MLNLIRHIPVSIQKLQFKNSFPARDWIILATKSTRIFAVTSAVSGPSSSPPVNQNPKKIEALGGSRVHLIQDSISSPQQGWAPKNLLYMGF